MTAAGQPLADVLPEQLAELVRGLSFSKSMRWDGGGLRFARPVRWVCAKLEERTVEVPLEGFRRAACPSDTASRTKRVEVESTRASMPTGCARCTSSRMPRGVRTNPRGLARQGLEHPTPTVLEGVPPIFVEWPEVLEGSFDERFLQLPGARDRHGDGVAPALLPARRQPLCVRGQRRRPRHRSPGETSVCSKGASRTRRSPSSVTWRGASRSSWATSASSPSSPAPRLCRQDGAPASSRRGVGWRRGLARSCAPCEG